MAKLDIYNKLSVTHLRDAAALTASNNGTALDLQFHHAAAFVVNVGAWTDGTFAFSLEDSADNSTFAACAAADVQGSIANVSSGATDQKSGLMAYIGTKRYVRMVITVTGSPGTGAIIGVTGMKSMPRDLNAL